MRYKGKILTMIGFLPLLALAGCGNATGDNNAGQEINGILTVAMGANPVTLDPSAHTDAPSRIVIGQIFDTLLNVDEDLEIVPGLATEWERIDELTVKFTLRDDVYFHNGEPFTAEDVKFSLSRAQASPMIASLAGDIDPDGFTILNDHQIKVSTTIPLSPFLLRMTHPALSMMNESAVVEAGEFVAQSPVGTGPFRFLEWSPGESIMLEAFENYYLGRPASDGLTLRIINEPSGRIIALETGEVDIALDVSSADIARVQDDSNLQLMRQLNFGISYMGFNNSREPFDNVLVRQAISYAIDVPSLVEILNEGVGVVARGAMNQRTWGFNDDIQPREFNPERARELLAEAGLEDGFSTTISSNSESAIRISKATVIANQLREIGIDAEIVTMDWGTYLEAMSNGDHDMFLLGWSNPLGDPDNALFPMFHTQQAGLGNNHGRFSNERVDEILELTTRTFDNAERLALFHEAQEILFEEAPWVFLDNTETIVAVSNNVEGFWLRNSGRFFFSDVYVD
ncbi:MAG: ABC transporter substrate-binding protein [Turicibacter sp.]|nr:ABC transporter substrate-binding protein [Turicibacter sp.]